MRQVRPRLFPPLKKLLNSKLLIQIVLGYIKTGNNLLGIHYEQNTLHIITTANYRLEVAYSLGMDELLIAALAQRVAKQLSTRQMFFSDTQARLSALPAPLIYQVLIQHVVLYCHLPWRLSVREVTLSVSDVYEYSPKSIVLEKGWFRDWSELRATDLTGVMLDLSDRCVSSTEGLDKVAMLYPSIELIHFRGCPIAMPVVGIEHFKALRAVNFRNCRLSSDD